MRWSAVAIAVVAALAWSAATAQTYPERPVRLLIAFPAGGTIDTLGRILAQKLGDAWGQNVVIENRAGAGGNIGAAAAAAAAPDGYTLHFGAQSLAVNLTLAPYQSLDPVKDFDPIILVATATDVLIVPLSSPFRSLRELIDYAKAHPGELNYCSLGVGTSSHLSTVQLANIAGLKLQHVPYTAFSQATTDLLSGRIALWIPTLGGSIGNIQAGKVRPLAISGPARAEALPEIPTFKELGIEFGESSWYALFAPKGTPREIIGKINREVERIIALPDVRSRAVTLGYRLAGGTPEQLGRFLADDIGKWAALARSGAFQ
ncbi:MAG TPA: tripartite tricarboxylate transporter substrate-binding protein [Xanthobacteraceae bacterium]|jgi:tripartite-type tricarboxylate transporter receptor subunit TctC